MMPKIADSLLEVRKEWLNHFLKGVGALNLVPDYPRTVRNPMKKEKILFEIDKQTLSMIRIVARDNGVTLPICLLAVYSILLHKYTNQNELTIGLELTNNETNSAFVPMRFDFTNSYHFIELLASIYEESNSYMRDLDYASNQLPLDLQKVLKGSQVLYEAAMCMNEFLSDTLWKIGLEIKDISEERVTMAFVYNPTSYKRETISQMSQHFISIIKECMEHPEQYLCEMNMVSEQERQMIEGFHQTETLSSLPETFHAVFEKQVELTPEQPALVYESKILTYRELDQKANQWAHYLIEKHGLSKEMPVGVMMESSIEYIIAIFAIMKAGGAFVPIHASLPSERMMMFIQDASIKTVMTTSKYQEKLLQLQLNCPTLTTYITIDTEESYEKVNSNHTYEKVMIESYCSNRLHTDSRGHDLSYIIFTSGTTGKPKGVMIEHKGIPNMVLSFQSMIGEVSNNHRVTQFANISFDGTIAEIAYSLLVGGTLHIVPPEIVMNYLLFEQFLNDCEITTTFLPPAYLVNLNPERIKTVKNLIVAGATSSLATVEKWRRNFEYINGYGPTEATCATTLWKCPAEQSLEQYTSVPIGYPLKNYEVVILNPDHQLQPIGVPGELCIAGIGLSRGYLHMQDMTNEKFIPHPYKPDVTIYKTGDLARWLPDGKIECLGRMDHQVKIRGYRIEIEEIQNQIIKYPAIIEAVVLDKVDEDGDKVLVAYLVTRKNITLSEIRHMLSEKLPDFMIPDYFVQVQSIPLTPNEKVDRNALLQIKSNVESGMMYEGPANEIEERLSRMWKQILHLDQISVHDEFFMMGGNSLKGASLLQQIHLNFHVNVLISKLFEFQTIRKLSHYIMETEKQAHIYMEKVPEATYYLTSDEQKRMYALSAINPAATHYNIPHAVEIVGDLNISTLQSAFTSIVHRHDVFRTTFCLKNDELVQIVKDDVPFEMEVIQTTEPNVQEMISSFIRPFDLHKDVLIRTLLICLPNKRHVLLMDMHHIIFDGLSMSVLTKELAALYDRQELPSTKYQYKDYVYLKNKEFQLEKMGKQEAFWLENFAQNIPDLHLPIDYSRPSTLRFEGDRFIHTLDKELLGKLNVIAKDTGSTLFMVLLGAFYVLLTKYSNQEDIVIGTVSSGRTHPDTHALIGMFVNTLPLRMLPQKRKTVKEFLGEIKEYVGKVLDHQEYPFDQLVQKLHLQRDNSRNPLFDVLFTIENEKDTLLNLSGVTTVPYEIPTLVAKFDLALLAEQREEAFLLKWEYRTNLFSRETILRMSNHFTHVLEQLTTNLDIPIGSVELITKEEKEEILTVFNETYYPIHETNTFKERWEEQVRLTPNHTALVFEGKQLSYLEVNARANQLAISLRKKGVTPNAIVAIMAKPSFEMIIGLIGIVKSGAAFLSIDSEYPKDRIQYMLKDSRATILLTQSLLLKERNFSGEIILLDQQEETSGEAGYQNLESIHTEHDLAYVIYTSGSTGNPKGVMIEHKSLVNLCEWHNHHYHITARDRTTKYAGFGFDATVWEIFPTLMSGATLYILEEEARKDLHLLHTYMEENQITVAFLPTPICEQFMYVDNHSLRLVVTGGDKLKSYKKTNYTVANNYGPTENTVVTTSCFVQEGITNIPIGKPIYNTRAYVCNTENQLQPIGVEGELCISGSGLSKGYLYNEALTKEKFVDNPFRSGEKMYRTGDIVKWLPDGNLQYIGRIDRQAKIRGFRIELGEIENRLLQHQAVFETVVVLKDDKKNNPYLCAYMVLDGTSCSIEDIREYLREHLAEYMVPTYLIPLSSLQLTQNGKIDLQALPDPKVSRSKEEFIELPRNEVEKILTDVWKDILGIDEVGVNDHFFSMGGDSIKAIQISSRMHTYGMQVLVKDILEQHTIRKLQLFVKQKTVLEDQGEITGETSLTPIQTWLFEQPLEIIQHFNQSYLFYSSDGLEAEIIRSVFAHICKHHDGLRTRYRLDEITKKMVATVSDSDKDSFEFNSFPIKEIDDWQSYYVNQAEKLQASMDISKGPLVKIAHFQTMYGDYLLIVIHHLIVDAVSWRVLLDDFIQGYECLVKQQKWDFPQKSTSFKTWSTKILEYAKGDDLLKEVEYWKKQWSEATPLPLDYESEAHFAKHTGSVSCHLDKEQTESLLKKTNHAYNTEIGDILLTALSLSMKQWTGNDQTLVAMESHGREQIVDADVTRTIGWFTSVYPVLLSVDPSGEIGRSLKEIKEIIRKIPNKGIGFGLLAYQSREEIKQQFVGYNKPDVCFNYLGQFSQMNNQNFQLSTLSRGQEVHPDFNLGYNLILEGVIVEGELELHLYYNRKAFEEKTVQNLILHYQQNLLDIITHCMNKTETEITPSDCTSEDIDYETLEAVFDLFEK
ncbi:amino acid adenylation domain-containing protein [Brevibacillus laterosporus]|uniref:Amino acid adenylation domain-containing protein n=1 Tax=Brevibacillus laterosporus TaxID=1465 RepID=A0A518VAX8_BRELA|nr:amino acid adenylation domain-containing protein [Brevibacillus laterosporus]